MPFPENLKKLRLQNDYTQQKLADLLHMNRTSISRYETGSLEPDINTLIKIAGIFNVSIDWLIT